MGPAVRTTGTVLSGRYRLTRKLGEGGMGEVYEAEPLHGGPHVALKVLRGEYFSDQQVRSRFIDEAQTCMRLVHPNIVRVVECAQTEDGLPYLVMDLLEGVPLGAYMRGGARVPVAQAVPILHAILAGLAMAHANGVVHRDLKPDNVFLTRDPGGRFVVKVLDFGIAKVMDVAGGMGNRTRTGMLLGTPAYMSPEQARNARDVDPRADLWSAGALFYEMIAGQVAFPAPTEFARLAALLTVEPQPIEQVDPGLGPLGPFLRRALQKDRDQRFSSAVDMSRALAAAMAVAPPARSEPPGTSEITSTLSSAERAPARELSSVGPARAAPGMPSGAARSSAAPQGTLASPAVQSVKDPLPQVALVIPSDAPPKAPSLTPRAFGETLESRPPNPARLPVGVAQKVVVALVLSAFLAGMLVGWLAGRI
jgi:eukaryotic-like serine/threonine-protein kinase